MGFLRVKKKYKMAEGSSRRHCVSYKQPNNKTVSYPNNQSIQNHLGFKNGVDLILGRPKDIEKSSVVSWKLYKKPLSSLLLEA